MECAELGRTTGNAAFPASTRMPHCAMYSGGNNRGRMCAPKAWPACHKPFVRPSLPVSRLRSGAKQAPVVVARAQGQRGNGGFLTGFLVGGLVCGTLGFLYAPQLSETLLDEHRRLKLPKFLETRSGPVTKEELVSRVDELNATMDRLAEDLGTAPANKKKSAATQ